MKPSMEELRSLPDFKEKTKKFDWSFLSEEDFMNIVNYYRVKGYNGMDSYRLAAESIKIQKRIHCTTQQVRSRYEYIRRKWSKQTREHNPEKIIKNNNKLETANNRILSTRIVDRYNRCLNLSEFAHSLVSNDKLVNQIDKLYIIQQKRHNPITKKKMIDIIANFFNIQGASLYNRYKTHKDKIVNKQTKNDLLLQEIERLEKIISSQNLIIEELSEKSNEEVELLSQRINELENQNIFGFLKMKIDNKPVKRGTSKIS